MGIATVSGQRGIPVASGIRGSNLIMDLTASTGTSVSGPPRFGDLRQQLDIGDANLYNCSYENGKRNE